MNNGFKRFHFDYSHKVLAERSELY